MLCDSHFRSYLSLDFPRHILKLFGVDRDSTFDGRAPPAYSCWPAGPRGVSAESSLRTAAWQTRRGGMRRHQARSPTQLAGLSVVSCLHSCPRRARTHWSLEGEKPAPASSPHRHGCGVSGTPPSKDAPVLTHARECGGRARPCGDRELPGAQRAAPAAAAAAPSLRARLRERVLTETATRTGVGAAAQRPPCGGERAASTSAASCPVDTWPRPSRARPAPRAR